MIPFCAIGQKCLISPFWMKRNSRIFAHGTAFSMFGRPQGLAFGIAPNDEQTKFDDDVRARLRAAMARLSCGVDMAVSAH
jgi:hypothetical protein